MAHQWESMAVDRIVERFADTDIDWWIAGGHAIDLFLGWETRPHADLDVEIFRSDSGRLFDVFDGWDIHVVSDSGAAPWTDPTNLDESVFGSWIRPVPTAPWQVEIMFAGGDKKEWYFRREPSIALSGSELIRTTDAGIPYGTPEVQLLYKSMQHRAKDDVDLARCLVRMTPEQRSWLANAIGRTSPNHAWSGVLAASLDKQHE
jgi:hypothetical protein